MSLLKSLQTDCQARLNAQTFFKASPVIPVYIQMQKDIQSKINETLVRIGVGVILLSARLSNSSPAAGMYPKWDRATLVARVIENVTINRGSSGTGQPADLIAEACAFWLHSWAPTCTGYKLLCDDVSIVDDPQCLIYDVRIFSGGLTNAAPERL
jgi:hypothetical protein